MIVFVGSDGDGVIGRWERTVMGQANGWMDDHLFRVVDIAWIERISCRSSCRSLRHLANDRAGHLGPDGNSVRLHGY